jgi:glycosyltransferase involved in cell wall biosynthesis
MQILFFADNFPPERNAQASRVYERAKYWVEWGHKVTVVTCAPNFPEGKVFEGYLNRWRSVEIMDGIRVVRVKSFITANAGTVLRMLDYLSFLPTGWWAGVREQWPDVVAATSPQMFTAVAGWGVATCRRVPFVLEISDLWPESVAAVGAMKSKNPVIWALERLADFLYARADRIVVVTKAFRKILEGRGVDVRKVAVARNGVDLRQYSPRDRDEVLARALGIGDGEFVVGYIGTLGMAHGLGNVLQAADRLRGMNVRFLLVGPGAERNTLIEEAARRGLDNVTLVPAQPKGEMPRYWSLCNAALAHLRSTPLFATVIPSKIFEAMGRGLPILLAAPRGEASEVVEGEGVGMWVEAGDANALAEAVLFLREQPEQRSAYAKASALAAPLHSRETQALQVLDVLQAASRRDGVQLEAAATE